MGFHKYFCLSIYMSVYFSFTLFEKHCVKYDMLYIMYFVLCLVLNQFVVCCIQHYGTILCGVSSVECIIQLCCYFLMHIVTRFFIFSALLASYLQWYIFCTTYPTQDHGVPGVYPKELGSQGEGRITGCNSTHTYSHTTYNLEMPVSLQCMSLDL